MTGHHHVSALSVLCVDVICVGEIGVICQSRMTGHHNVSALRVRCEGVKLCW